MGLQVIHILSNSQCLTGDLFASQNGLRTARTTTTYSCLASSGRLGGLPRHMKTKQQRFFLSVANGDRVAATDYDKETRIAKESDLNNGSSSVHDTSTDSSERDGEIPSKAEEGSAPQLSEVNNGSLASRNSKAEAPSVNQKPALKRSPLTAREKLRAARVLSRYTESKATKGKLGNKLLDALKESEKGKRRSGLPEAPANLFDDSKRGLPKPGWTFELPGDIDVFLIAFSFVFITSVMLATTYIVWKAGGIHYNEY